MKHLLSNYLKCKGTPHLNQLKQVHALITIEYPSLTSSFFEKLLKLSNKDYACKVFQQIHQPYPPMCNSSIAIYSWFDSHYRDRKIDSFTSVVKSCTAVLEVGLGKQVHSLVIRYGFEWELFVRTTLVDFYAENGDVCSAKIVFDGIQDKDPVTYNAMITGYSKCGDSISALKLFDEMPERNVASWNSIIVCYAKNGDLSEAKRMFKRMISKNFSPNEITMRTMLSVCAESGDLEMGMIIIGLVYKHKMLPNMKIMTAMVNMLAKCAAVDEAHREFDKMTERDIFAWGTMIAGYAKNGRSNEALELFEEMKREKFRPNDFTLSSILSACAQLGSKEVGERVGRYVETFGFNSNIYVASSLINMYSMCGHLSEARRVFGKITERDTACWNAIIKGLAINGYALQAIDLYKEMEGSGKKPDDVTFVELLTACAHAGLVDRGLNFFDSMKTSHEIVPKVHHYACIVDLLCRCGRLNEAYELICKMEIEQIEPNNVRWCALLSACRTHSNFELTKIAEKQLVKLEPENPGNYVLLANLHMNLGRWQDASKTRRMMRDKQVQKTAAYSWIELEDGTHEFLVSDLSHPRSYEIYSAIHVLALQCYEAD